jgi:DNA-binding winged helix-turn-helix (wHTH) protein
MAGVNTGRAGAVPSDAIRFGSFTIDIATGELTRQGRRIPLQDQPARVLGLLVMRAGRLVTREELRDALWPEDTFVEFDAAIAVAINKIRRALGDSATNPRFIETVPKHGYRFLADVQPLLPDAIEAPPVSSLAPRAASPLRPASSWPIIAAVIVITGAAVAVLANRTANERTNAPAKPSTSSIEANRLYLEGRWFMDQRSIADLRSAIAAFRRATEVDPGFAVAYSWLANAYGMLGYMGAMPPLESRTFTVASAARALQLDDRLAEAHLVSAGAQAFFQWRWAEADDVFRRALTLDPTMPRAIIGTRST